MPGNYPSPLHRVYFLLAAFDVLAVCLGLYLSDRTSQIHSESIAVNRAWAVRQRNFLELGQLAAAVKAPGNDVFDSRKVEEARRQLRSARATFETRFGELRAELGRNVDQHRAAPMVSLLDEIHTSMNAVCGEAEGIFRDFEQNQPQMAGSRMAAMDHNYERVHQAITSLSRQVAAEQDRQFAAQTDAAASVENAELLMAVVILFMVACAIAYGIRIERNMQATSELLRTQKEAEAANRAKSAFLANMSHELRSPLNSVINFAGLLEEELEDRGVKELLPDVKRITNASRHLLGIVNDVLDLSKIEAGHVDLSVGQFSVQRVVEGVVETATPLAAHNQNRLVVEPNSAGECFIENDEQKFRQCLLNLLSNACKFTEAGEVRVGWSAAGNGVFAVHVSDTGIGMSPDQTSRLFQPFQQVDADAGRRYGGTGLGLAISHKYCRLMGGDLRVESEAGQGSKFTILIPALAPAERALAGRAPEGF